MRVPELAATTNFTFLTGASHPEEMVERAAELGLSAIAITDRNSVAGVVRAHVRLREMKRDAVTIKPRNITGSDVREHAARQAEIKQAEIRQAEIKQAWEKQADAKPSRIRSHVRIDPSSRLPEDKAWGGLKKGEPSPEVSQKERVGRTISQGEKERLESSLSTLTSPSGQRFDNQEHSSELSPGGHHRAAPAPPADGCCPQRRDKTSEPVLPNLIIGARLVLTDTPMQFTALCPDRTAYGRLCRLLTDGKREAEKGNFHLTLEDLAKGAEGLILIAHLPDPCQGDARSRADQIYTLKQAHQKIASLAGIALTPAYDGRDAERFARLAALSGETDLPLVATCAPMMHRGNRRQLADVLTCIREGCTVDTLGRRALPNAEQHLRGPDQMARIFARHPEALARAKAIADACTFSLDELRYEYPDEGNGETPQDRLARLAAEGLNWRYPDGVPDRAQQLVNRELDLIGKLSYAPYFLTVRDIVKFARDRGILCQGRGSAANSTVCYALGITEIAPDTISMVFERFVSEARDEPPDIDVDFEHERREEVIQHIYDTYGRHRAGLTATVIHFRSRAAIREVGKAMGLSIDVTSALSGQVWGWSREAIKDERLREVGLDPRDRRLKQTLALIEQIIGFPRHLSQHVGGFVITAGRLDELCPIENAAMEDRTVIEWDKDDIDALGILKVDVLALGMLTCIRKAFDLIAGHVGTRYTLATLPQECPEVYDMLCAADSLGVFQVESRAQMNFLPRMRPRNFYDLVIEVAIIRPGPIQGDMVHPFLRRRNGEEKVEFPSDELGEVLGKTLGVPLFQEQAMQIAIVGAGFTPDQADRLRRSLATFKKHGNVSEFRTLFLKGMKKNGYDDDFAERCFSQIEGFGSYGFPESHAASFALLVYASSWLKCHHPGIFACALLNSQPMGFYAPAQIVRDAREHGVEVRAVSIAESFWDNVMEPDGKGGLALRLGFRQIKSLREDDAAWITAARGNGYLTVEDVWRRAGVGAPALRALAEADAFADLGLSRRDALWAAKAIGGEKPLPLFGGDIDGEGIVEPAAHLPQMSEGEEVIEDYVAMRLTLRAHPMSFLRDKLTPSPTGGHNRDTARVTPGRSANPGP
ncbi:MAG: error-prone DNA polymerase [Pseudomonadota bacterium]